MSACARQRHGRGVRDTQLDTAQVSVDKSQRYIQRNSYSNDDELLHVTQGTLTDKKTNKKDWAASNQKQTKLIHGARSQENGAHGGYWMQGARRASAGAIS